MQCPDCGMKNEQGREQCEFCGASLIGVEEIPVEGEGGWDTPPGPDTGNDIEEPIPFEETPESSKTLPELPYAIGIDLGTTNSVLAIYRNGRPETLEVEGSKLLPSVVSFRDSNTILVGKKAKAGMEIHPETTVRSIKRKMGNRKFRANMHGRRYSPVNISAMILRKLADAASEGLGGRVRKAVITVPAYFDANQNEDTELAAKEAGLEVLRLLPEPTAAAIAYGLDKERNQTLLVYDLGGGTFDVSILRVENRNFTAIAVRGDMELGGDDIDNKVVDYLIQETKGQTRIDLRTDKKLSVEDKRRAWQLLKESAERAKIELSSALTTFVDIPDLIKGESISVELTREKFEELIKPVLTRTEMPIRAALQDARLDPDDIDRVILVGGSTKIPVVRQMVKSMIKDPYTAESVDEMVAHGAATVAANLVAPELAAGDLETVQGQFGEWDPQPPEPIEFTDVTGHSLGVRIVDENKFEHAFSKIIEHGSKLPAENVETYTTLVDHQPQLDVYVFQGEDYDCRKNVEIGHFTLSGIQHAPAGVPQIEISFMVTVNNTVQVTARDRNTAAQKSAELNVRKG